MSKDNSLAIILGIAAVAGGAYLLTRQKSEDGEGEGGGGLFPQLPDITSMPQFSLPSMPQFSLPSMPQFSMPQLPGVNLPSIPEIPQILPDVLPDFGGGDGVPLAQKILNLLGVGDKGFDPGSYLREGHVTTIESGSIEIGGEEWEVIPQYPNLQMTPKDFLLTGWKNVFLDPIGTLTSVFKYGSPVVKTVKTSDPAAIAAPSPEAVTSTSTIQKPLYETLLPNLIKPETSSPQPVESKSIAESKPQPESNAPYDQGLTGIYIVPTAARSEAKQVLDSGEFNVWLKDQQAGNFYDPEATPPCLGTG